MLGWKGSGPCLPKSRPRVRVPQKTKITRELDDLKLCRATVVAPRQSTCLENTLAVIDDLVNVLRRIALLVVVVVPTLRTTISDLGNDATYHWPPIVGWSSAGNKPSNPHLPPHAKNHLCASSGLDAQSSSLAHVAQYKF